MDGDYVTTKCNYQLLRYDTCLTQITNMKEHEKASKAWRSDQLKEGKQMDELCPGGCDG